MTVLKYYNESTSQWEPLVIGAQGPTGPQGIQGIQGVPGADGEGVPAGGTTDQVLAKVDGTDYNTAWVDAGGGGFNTITEITSSNASYDVSGITGFAKITVIAGGGGGGTGDGGAPSGGGDGGDSSVVVGGTTITASGGEGGPNTPGTPARVTGAYVSYNGQEGTVSSSQANGDGAGGEIVVSYQDLTSVSSINVTIGAGGTGGAGFSTLAGFRGVVILEYTS